MRSTQGSGKVWIISAAAVLVTVLALGGALYGVMGYLGKADNYVKQVKADNFAYLSGTARQGQTILLGDSITEQFPAGDLFGGYTEQTGTLVYNRGISGETSDKTLARLEDSALKLKPRNLVLLIGINDIGQKVSVEDIAGNVEQMIRKTREQSPKTNLILQAVYPVNEDMPQLAARYMVGGRKNSTVRQLNEKLEALARREGVTYLDLTGVLKDENGNLNTQYTYDGLHPTAKGYEVIAGELVPLLK